MTTKQKIDYDSIENQEIKRKFVQREIYTCFSYEMDNILNIPYCDERNGQDLPTFEDIENLYEYKCPECGEGYQEEEQAKECCNSEEEIENGPQEIYEWWIVSEFLYRKLKEKGYPVLEWGNNYYWARTCTGQAILLDWIISDICQDLEILDGQKYSWAKNEKN